MKKQLLITLQSDYFARDFIEGGMFDAFSKDYDMLFVTGEKLTLDISKYGKVIHTYNYKGWRSAVWKIGFGLRNIPVVERFWAKYPDRYNIVLRGHENRYRKLVILLFKLRLAGFVSKLCEKIQFLSAPDFLHGHKIDLAFLPTGINDPLWDDVVSLCKKKKIPSLTVTVNWDNIASKLFFQKPDYLGVWGQQGYLMARLFQDIPDEKLITVGTPRFESLYKSNITKEEAKKKLGIEPGQRMLLFAGAGSAFDEVSLLEEFEKACEQSRLPGDLVLFYKPHPKRHVRSKEPVLRTGEYKRIKVIQDKGFTPLNDYPTLFRASEALLTPMSTMMLESAIMGNPSVGIGYDDPNHAEVPWSLFRHGYHLRSITDGDWFVPCFEKNAFIPAILEVLKVAKDERKMERMKASTNFSVMRDGQPYVERILGILNRIRGDA